MKKHTQTVTRRATFFIFAALLVWAGYFLYTGKGWLLLVHKETVADFYFQRGLYYFNGGTYNLNAARSNFEEALTLSYGMYPFAHFQLSRTYFIESNFSSALTEADAELLAYPDHYRVHYLKGLIYGYRKQYIQAEAEFKSFLASQPASWAARNDLAWIYFSEGDYASAAAITHEGLLTMPGIPWLQNSYGVAEMNLGNYKVAETYLESASKAFESMTPEQWGNAYPGNNPDMYGTGLADTRAAILQNLQLVHSKLGD